MEFQQKFYCAWSLDDSVLYKSSSGGVFSVLAKYVIDKNGIVFGAFQDQNTLDLRHAYISTIEEIDLLRKSKYYQSDSKDAYHQVLKFLESGKHVLFSGTACQIAALYSFLNKKVFLDNLITVDILCHGVSNKSVFKNYVCSKQNRSSKKIVKIEFRNKDVPWFNGGGTSMKHIYEDGTYSIFRNEEDTYFIGFNSNLILRPSCYSCPFAGMRRKADFTIADFWGATSKRLNESQKNKGASVLLINSLKAEKILSEVGSFLKYEEILEEEFVPYNLAFTRPQIANKNRSLFFKNNQKGMDFDRNIHKCLKKKFLVLFIKKIFGTKAFRLLKGLIGKGS